MATAKSSFETEVCVLGGGPAGSLLARRLAQFGHRTLLIDRTAQGSSLRAESLPPSILSILESANLRAIVDAAVFFREKRALLLWGAGIVEEKSFDDVPSMLIDRALFDKLLREAAHHAGVRLMAPAAARSPQRLPCGGWIVPVLTSDGSALIRSKFLVDARGKRRSAFDNYAPPTAAISAAWMLGAQSYTETRVEAGHDEWFWGSPLPNGAYVATIFLDSARLAGLTEDGRIELYRALLARSKLLRELLQRKMIKPVWVRDATSGINRDLIGNDFIRVGEAAVSIDPLSSQGIQAAFLTAIQGSAAVHTLLAGHDASPAIEFYRERQQSAAKHASHNAMRLYRAGNHDEGNRFWLRRSPPAADTPANTQREPPSAVRVPCGLGLSPALRIVKVPVLSEALITRAPALSHPALEHPIAYLGGFALVPLIEDATEASAADQILKRWTKRMPAKAAWNIMTWMCAVGILVPHTHALQDYIASVELHKES